MGFLKKLGSVLAKVGAIVVGINPFIPDQYKDEAALVVDKMSQLHSLIIQVEAMGAALNLTGQQKLEAITASATALFLQSATLAGHEVADKAMFIEAVRETVSAQVKMLNALKGDNVKTEELL